MIQNDQILSSKLKKKFIVHQGAYFNAKNEFLVSQGC